MHHRIPAALGTALILFAGAALAQNPAKSPACRDRDGGNGRQQRVREMREMMRPATASLNVDAATLPLIRAAAAAARLSGNPEPLVRLAGEAENRGVTSAAAPLIGEAANALRK